jgi:alanine dehydrogenase
VVVADADPEAAAALVDHATAEGFDARAGSVAEAAGCDVVSSTTPVTEPVVERSAVGERTHLNAIGADAAGKQELESAVLTDATVVIDDRDQCVHSGEINVPWDAGLLDEDAIHAELGAVVAGSASGRTAETGVTVFDSTGLAVQDVAASHVVYERATADDVGTEFDLLGL